MGKEKFKPQSDEDYVAGMSEEQRAEMIKKLRLNSDASNQELVDVMRSTRVERRTDDANRQINEGIMRMNEKKEKEKE